MVLVPLVLAQLRRVESAPSLQHIIKVVFCLALQRLGKEAVPLVLVVKARKSVAHVRHAQTLANPHHVELTVVLHFVLMVVDVRKLPKVRGCLLKLLRSKLVVLLL